MDMTTAARIERGAIALFDAHEIRVRRRHGFMHVLRKWQDIPQSNRDEFITVATFIDNALQRHTEASNCIADFLDALNAWRPEGADIDAGVMHRWAARRLQEYVGATRKD